MRENDDLLLYPANLALMDTLEMLGLPYEFYSHPGGHNMPSGFRNRAYLFLDSMMMGPSVHTGMHKGSRESRQLNFELFPNPANESCQMTFTLDQPASVKIEILNAFGNIVWRSDLGNQSSGKHTKHLNTRHLASGIYFCKILAGEQNAVKRLVKL